jgi:DNA-binding transcriptional ArsR family regulator
MQPLEVLASPRRREILRLVWRAELGAGEIHRALGDVSFAAVSQQLAILREAGLVAVRAEGRRRWYRALPRRLGPIGGVLESLWSDSLYRLELAAELEERRRGPRPGRRRRRRRSAPSKPRRGRP